MLWKVKYGFFERMIKIGDMPVEYNSWGRISSIGYLNITYQWIIDN